MDSDRHEGPVTLHRTRVFVGSPQKILTESASILDLGRRATMRSPQSGPAAKALLYLRKDCPLSTETAEVATTNEHSALVAMLEDLNNVAVQDENEERDIQKFLADIMDNILSAESFEDIFEAQNAGMTSGKDFADIPFFVEDVEWRRSTITNDDGKVAFPFYAIMKVHPQDDPDKTVVLNTGGLTIVSTIYALWKKGYFKESRLVRIKRTETDAGRAFLSLWAVKQPTSKRAK